MTSTTTDLIPDAPRRRRGGRPPMDASQKRVHAVTVWLSPSERAYIDLQCKASATTPAQYMRHLALESSVPASVIPDEFRQAWADLARVGGNLNQLSHHMNQLALQGELFTCYKPIVEKLVLELPALRLHLDELRRILLKRAGGANEG